MTEDMNSSQRAVIVDFNMPFWSMVKFMVKWVIASIPALTILAALGFLATLVYQSGSSLFSG